MQFMYLHDGWRVTFLEADVRTALPRCFTFQEAAKVVEMAVRGGADSMSADRAALDYAIEMGRGSAWLNLTAEQYGKLR